MNTKEQNEIKIKYFTEAVRYMENAKETLKKAGKKDNFYLDDKYVKTACGTAYNAVLKALDGYFLLKEIQKTKGRKSIEYYQEILSKKDKTLLKYLDNAYKILHLSGYYDGVTSVKIVADGFEFANTIINKIKPAA
jgi:hypothetical protein